MIRRPAAALLLLVASPALAGLAPRLAFTLQQDSVDSRGKAVTVNANGDVFAASTEGADLIVSRYSQDLAGAPWSSRLTGLSFTPRAVLATPTCVFVFGDQAAIGHLITLNAVDGSMTANTGYGGYWFADAAFDPVDGSMWAVMAAMVAANTGARLWHFGVAAGGITTASSSDIQYLSTFTDPKAIAVAPSMVYVGGQAQSGGFNYPWIAGVPRGGSTPSFQSVGGSALINFYVSGLAARSGQLFSALALDLAGTNQDGRLAKNDPGNGTFLNSISTFSNAPMLGKTEFTGNVLVHPTLPVVVASNGKGFAGYDLNLGDLGWAVSFLGGQLGTPPRLAMTDGLNFSVYGAYTAWPTVPAPPPYHASVNGERMLSAFGSSASGGHLLAAPNVLDLAAGTGIRLVVKSITGPTHIKIFDLAGRLVGELPDTLDVGANHLAEVGFAGKLKNGDTLAPGMYLAVPEGPGMSASDRCAFVVQGKKK